MLITGTVANSARPATSAWGTVRTPIADTNRDSTWAVSRIDSPREICISPSRRISGWPPSSATPTSNETRVRVEGCSKISATLRPASALDAWRSAFSWAARSSRAVSSSAVSSSPVRK